MKSYGINNMGMVEANTYPMSWMCKCQDKKPRIYSFSLVSIILAAKKNELEKKIEEKGKELEVQIISPVVPAQTNEEAIVQDMSQISLRDLEITSLKNQNTILEDATLKKEEDKKAIEISINIS